MKARGWVAASVLLLLELASPAFGQYQRVPLRALDNWMWYNDYGWQDLDSGKYDRAEQKFRLAIKEIEKFAPANRKLMARTYCDLARVFYYQKRFAEAEPLAKWALAVRDADKTASADAVFQCLFTLGSILQAQERYAEAEHHFKRALCASRARAPRQSRQYPGDARPAGICPDQPGQIPRSRAAVSPCHRHSRTEDARREP